MRTGALYLVSLDISGNPLDDEGVKILGEALIASAVFFKDKRSVDNFESNSQLSEDSSVSFGGNSNNKIELEASAPSFIDPSKFVVKFIPLKHLNVSTCKFGPKGFIALLESIVRLTTLETLDVSHNNIGPRPSYMTAAADDGIGEGSDDETVDSEDAKVDKMDIAGELV